MLIYLITSLPILSLNKELTISKASFIKNLKSSISKDKIIDFNLLVKFEESINSYKKNKNIKLHKRECYFKIYERSTNYFLLEWAKNSLNLEEAITGLMCKYMKLPKEEAVQFFYNRFDSTSQIILNNYEKLDLGLSKKFSWFTTLVNIINNKKLEDVEKNIDLLRLNIINAIKIDNMFSVETLLSYYLKLSILERQASFNKNAGKIKLEKILNSINI